MGIHGLFPFSENSSQSRIIAMPIPDFQSIMRPLLDLAADGKEHPLAAAREELAETFKLTDEDKATLLPSGRTPRFANRVAWAKVYLSQAGALDTPRKGFFQITDRGRELLRSVPKRITIKDLQRFPEFAEFRAPKQHKEETATQSATDDEGQTPEEMLENSYQRFRTEIASELLSRVKEHRRSSLSAWLSNSFSRWDTAVRVGSRRSNRQSWR
jgi:restriction system protein